MDIVDQSNYINIMYRTNFMNIDIYFYERRWQWIAIDDSSFNSNKRK